MSVLLVNVFSMGTSTFSRAWTDQELIEAVKESVSWRAVTRKLGLASSSANVVRAVRRHADELGLDSSHFRGARRWSDEQLKNAISRATSWDGAITALGLSTNSGNIRPFLKSHAIRLGVDYGHLTSHPATEPAMAGSPIDSDPDLNHLRYTASSIAAAWFTLCGHTVTFPIEPAHFDLLVSVPRGIKRIQVKTTTSRGKYGWGVTVGHRPYTTNDLGPLSPYDPDEIDFFFIVDGDMALYLIPMPVIAGRVDVLLSAYREYIVGNAGGLLLAGLTPASASLRSN